MLGLIIALGSLGTLLVAREFMGHSAGWRLIAGVLVLWFVVALVLDELAWMHRR